MSGADKSRTEGEQPNALMRYAIPLEQEVRRLIATHGAEAVKAEIRAATKPRRGRKQEKDWPLLYPYLQADAKDWLAGRDPMMLRSQKGIAREVANQNPGHSADSTMRRIERKLAQHRKRFMFYLAHDLSRREYPFSDYMRVSEELAKLDIGDTWRRSLSMDQQILARYLEVYGEPNPRMTWEELEAKPRYPDSLGALSPKPPATLAGMFGSAPRAKG